MLSFGLSVTITAMGLGLVAFSTSYNGAPDRVGAVVGRIVFLSGIATTLVGGTALICSILFPTSIVLTYFVTITAFAAATGWFMLLAFKFVRQS